MTGSAAPAMRPAATGLRAGAGAVAIEFDPQAFPVDGFSAQSDPLFARVLILDADGCRLALAAIDQTSIQAGHDAQLRQTISSHAGVSVDSVVLCATHTFSAPHVVPPSQGASGSGSDIDEAETARSSLVRDAVDDAVRRATRTAAESLRPVRVGYAVGTTDVNVNRDVLTDAGWWLGANPRLPSDHGVPVLRIDGVDGQPIAVLFNCAVQSSVLNGSVSSGNVRTVSGDLAGAAARYVEAKYPTAVALFTVGAAGDQSPHLMASRYLVDRHGRAERRDPRDDGLLLVELLGERLGNEVVRAAESITTRPVPPLGLGIRRDRVDVISQRTPLTLAEMRPSHQYSFVAGDPVQVQIVTVRIADVAFVGLAPELCSVTGLEIKRRSPYPNTIVATMVDGAAKYMADEASFNRITYAAMSSRFACGSAETVTSAIVEILERDARSRSHRGRSTTTPVPRSGAALHRG